jgi:hypothetical protein
MESTFIGKTTREHMNIDLTQPLPSVSGWANVVEAQPEKPSCHFVFKTKTKTCVSLLFTPKKHANKLIM